MPHLVCPLNCCFDKAHESRYLKKAEHGKLSILVGRLHYQLLLNQLVFLVFYKTLWCSLEVVTGLLQVSALLILSSKYHLTFQLLI